MSIRREDAGPFLRWYSLATLCALCALSIADRYAMPSEGQSAS